MLDNDAAHAASPWNEWNVLRPGMRLTVVKVAPDGAEAARYAADVATVEQAELWVGLRATWAYPTTELDGLLLRTGDRLLEWFSPLHWFNAFAVHAPGGELRGWYANVTYPPRLDTGIAPAVLTWHDLYLDLVGLADGTFATRDEDELRDAGLAASDPQLYRDIIAAMHELTRRWEWRLRPFGAPAGNAKTHTIVPKSGGDAQP